jgi:hypothetical protein
LPSCNLNKTLDFLQHLTLTNFGAAVPRNPQKVRKIRKLYAGRGITLPTSFKKEQHP